MVLSSNNNSFNDRWYPLERVFHEAMHQWDASSPSATRTSIASSSTTSSSGNTSAGCIERDVASSEVPIGYNPRLVDEGKKIRWTDGIDAIYISW